MEWRSWGEGGISALASQVRANVTSKSKSVKLARFISCIIRVLLIKPTVKQRKRKLILIFLRLIYNNFDLCLSVY